MQRRSILGSVVVLAAAVALVASAPSRGGASPVTRATSPAAGAFVGVTPTRVLNTQTGTGTTKRSSVPAGGVVTIAVTGTAGVPSSGVAAVVLTLTVAAPTATSFATAYPADAPLPHVATVDYTQGVSLSNAALVPVSADGRVSIYTRAAVAGLAVDLSGYVAGTPGATAPTAPGSFVGITPNRVLNTETGTGTTRRAAVPAGGIVTVRVTGTPGVPASGVSAVVLTLTVAAPAATSYATAYPAGPTLPHVATVDYTKGVSLSDLAVVPVSADGSVSVYTNASVAGLVIDVGGYVAGTPGGGAPTAAGAFAGVTPARLLNTATGQGVPARSSVPGGTSVAVQATGAAGIPATGVAAVVLTVTVADPAATSYATAYPTGPVLPHVATVDYAKGVSLSNLAVVPVSASGQVSLYTNATVGALVIDVAGYVAATPDDSPPAAVTRLAAAGAVPITGGAAERLTWTVPSGYAGAVVRRAAGDTPPSSPTDGTAVATVSGQTGALTDGGVSRGAAYAYAVFGFDASGAVGPGATLTTTAPTAGADVSTNNCGTDYPPTALFGIVEPLDGFAFSGPNDCLAAQDAWAHATGSEQFYLPLADKGTASAHWPVGATSPKACGGATTDAGCAYDYGYAQARDAFVQASTTGHQVTTWWLDVEDNGMGNWSNATGAQSQAQNVQVVTGARDYLLAQHVALGFYSTRAFWTQLLAGTTALNAYPEWYATSGSSDLAAYCSTPFAAGAHVALVQDIGNGPAGLDADYRC